jgi:antitoxin VapB
MNYSSGSQSGKWCSLPAEETEKGGEAIMARIEKAKVFMSGPSQAERIPVEYRFSGSEVYIRRDPASGDLILSQAPGSWEEIFVLLDGVGVPDDFLTPADRAQLRVQDRVEY